MSPLSNGLETYINKTKLRLKLSIATLMLIGPGLYYFTVSNNHYNEFGKENNVRYVNIKGKSQIASIVRTDWLKEKQPKFCESLIRNPQPYCKTGDCMFAHHYQDYYIFSTHFRHLHRPGIYLDVASNDPIIGSTTYFFDRCLQWRGICVEGNDKYYEPLLRERSCNLVPTCVGKVEGQLVNFHMAGPVGGILDNNYNQYTHYKKNGNPETRSLRCTTLKHVLQRMDINVIDYFSLDVEGHEIEVLKGFDFENVTVNVLSIEIKTHHILTETLGILSYYGYRKHSPNRPAHLKYDKKFLRSDYIFVHKNVQFGHPK